MKAPVEEEKPIEQRDESMVESETKKKRKLIDK
jgi:hypothetical protein